MSIDMSGLHGKVEAASVSVHVTDSHPLIKLVNMLPWKCLMTLVVTDLMKTTAKGYWWMGRKIKVRIHLAVFILQKLYNLTDRKAEYGLRDNAAFQLFCGVNIVEEWCAPDHTKIEEFRNRLSPETQRSIANEITKIAVTLGFADPTQTDFDSTVQEANISYPSDATLMTKLAGLGKKVVDYLKEKIRGFIPESLNVDMKRIKEIARLYFFMGKNTAIERRRQVFAQLHHFVKQQMYPVIEVCSMIDPRRLAHIPWNIRRAMKQIATHARRYLLDVAHFTRTNTLKIGKILSFHAHAMACIQKGKIGKLREFGRVFQLGRIKGNFLFALESTSLQMNDKKSFIPLLLEHEKLFGKGSLKSVATDKGYWSSKNFKGAVKLGVQDVGLQHPTKVKSPGGQNTQKLDGLRDRRAGIEPLIGHTKHGGQLGRSRMKSDTATLAAGYGSVLGFNLRQLIRHRGGKMSKVG
jgi:IS5 family transposase